MSRQCSVFISSTSEDLKEYRAAAEDAIKRAGVRPEAMEYFAASGGPALRQCIALVSPCDVVVVIVAERYGWVPPDQPGPDAKSITWLECEHAAGRGRELLVFLLGESVPWAAERTEEYRLAAAVKNGPLPQELINEVTRNVAKLKDFRAWLGEGRTTTTFTTPDDLSKKVMQALHQWFDRHPDRRPVHTGFQNPREYLNWMRDQTSTIDIKGLGDRAGKAGVFDIDKIYIPLTTAAERGEALGREPTGERKAMELEETLTHRRLVIVGDPGSGKTTFLRRIAFEMTKAALHETAPSTAAELPGLWAALRAGHARARAPFPILIRIADLISHITESRQHAGLRALPAPDSPEWLVRFLATRNTSFAWGLSAEFFADKLASGEAVVLLDGLDEAPEREKREQAARLFENATGDDAYSSSRFVVTTRPYSYSGRTLLAGFHQAQIDPLTPEAVEAFLDCWCRAVYHRSEELAAQHREELSYALSAVPEIREMAGNPVMLTALAVVHFNESHLPDQRADLYDSVLTWLSRQREQRRGRETPARCLRLLATLAFAMQNHPEGRQVRIPLSWGAGKLASEFESPRAAANFIEEEMADSGIVVSRGEQVAFWHLTFQEYLAARVIAGQQDQEQLRLLFHEDKIYSPEWREMVSLLAGVLWAQGQGQPRVDGLVSAIVERSGTELADRARSAGLLGAIVKDLKGRGYQPADSGYRGLMDAVVDVFDWEKSKNIEFAVRLDAAEALGQAGDPRLQQENWVRIEGHGDVKTFEIGKYPVTVAEYQHFLETAFPEKRWWIAGGYEQRHEPWDWEAQKQHPNRAVSGANWYEAAAYAAWRRARLPTEAEWELAARGKEGREHPWGKEEPDERRANYGENGPKHVTPVGLYPWGATPEGVQDMAGNVLEWVDAWYDEERKYRVLRGGSWGYDYTGLRASDRLRLEPEYRNVYVGFRVAREVSYP
jgi:hypothetical protein